MDSSPSNSLTTPRPTPYEKSAEFARLYYFFEKLTQPRSRGTSRNNKHHHHRSMSHEESETTTTSVADAPIPEDIAPLLKNLSAILTKDEPFDHGDGDEDGDMVDAELLGAGEAQVCIPETPTTAMASIFATTTNTTATHSAQARPISPSDHASMRPRRYTVAVSKLASDHARPSDVASRHVRTQTQTRFPLREKRYPFTFKLLLHKLYDLEDWAAKIQEVLVASQEQFRSLNAATSPTGNNSNSNTTTTTSSSTVTGGGCSASGGGVPCSPVSPGTAFSGSVFGPVASPPSLESPSTRRRRAQSTSKTGTSNDAASNAGSVLTRCSGGGGGGPATSSRPPPQPSRAVKKRIVNRRRSTNGLGGEDVVGKMGEWMYDAAVSSVDAEQVDDRGKDGSLRRKRVLSSIGFAEEERRFGGRDVTNVSL